MGYHAQVPLRTVVGASADVCIAPLVEWFNDRGCATEFSCQGGPCLEPGESPDYTKVAYIAFVSVADGLKARDVLTQALEHCRTGEERALWDRVAGAPMATSDSAEGADFVWPFCGDVRDAARTWYWVHGMRNIPGARPRRGHPTPSRPVVNVYFPHTDVDLVLKALTLVPALSQR